MWATTLRKLANEKGVHYAKKLSGHRTDQYIWRYVQPMNRTSRMHSVPILSSIREFLLRLVLVFLT